MSPNLIWAKYLFMANIISNHNQSKMSQNANSKCHRNGMQNVTNDGLICH
jgi:hypothetical protein